MKKRPDIFWPWPKCWLQNIFCFMWAMTRKLGLSKLRSERTFLNFIDFSLQCVLELEDWCMVKRKMYWDRSKSFFCLRELIVSSGPRSAPQTAKKQCFLKSMPRWLLSLERDNQLDFELILVDTCWLCVDTELTLQSEFYFASHWYHSTSLKPYNEFTRLRFHLTWVLNCLKYSA